MTEGEVAIAIAKYYGLRSLILVQNCIGITYHEADLLHVTSSLYLEEIEIKVSVADFKAEFVTPSRSKRYKHEYMHQSLVKRYYIAMPNDVYLKVKDLIPDHAGVFLIYGDGEYMRATKHKLAKDFKNTRALEAKELMKLSAMACSRLWSYKAKGSCGRK